jgi:hypothetical protein
MNTTPGFFVALYRAKAQDGTNVLLGDRRTYIYSELDSKVDLQIPDFSVDLSGNCDLVKVFDEQGETAALYWANVNEYREAYQQFSKLLDGIEGLLPFRPTAGSIVTEPLPGIVSFESKRKLQVLAHTLTTQEEWFGLNGYAIPDGELKRWDGSKKDFANLVNAAFDEDLKQGPNQRKFKNIRDATRKTYISYGVSDWPLEKCYDYVRQVRSEASGNRQRRKPKDYV